MRKLCALALPALLAVACEDGPEQIWEPISPEDAAAANSTQTPPWMVMEDVPYDAKTDFSDEAGRARFCSEAENSALVREMTAAPIIPDREAGLVPLWDASGLPTYADDLLGPRSEGKLCDPEIYSNAYVWGPLYEVIFFFNSETHLAEELLIGIYGGYTGALAGSYTNDASTEVPVVLVPKRKVVIGGQELTAAMSWIAPSNVSKLYRMIRQTHFGDARLPDAFDCIAAKRCQIFSVDSPDGTISGISFLDSGVVLQFEPDGTLTYIDISLVRVAQFELGATMDFSAGAGMLEYQSPSCTFDLAEELSFEDFGTRCLGGDAEETLRRANYNVNTMRDGVFVAFNAITLGFLRDMGAAGAQVLIDGERPADGDELFSIEFYNSLKAPIAQFVPADLALQYKARLEAHLADLVSGVPGHPLATYVVAIPDGISQSLEAQAIGELFYEEGGEELSWVDVVLDDLQTFYRGLTPAERAAVPAGAMDKVYLLKPFVDGVLWALTGGASDGADAVKRFYFTDDARWCIGFANFIAGGKPYRLTVQYSRNYGAITAVTMEAGYNYLDTIYNDLLSIANDYQATSEPYFFFDVFRILEEAQDYYDGQTLARYPMVDIYSLGGRQGIQVLGFNRQLKTLDVSLAIPSSSFTGNLQRVRQTVSGFPIEDNTGYLRQVAGESWEFVPADKVYLYGKESAAIFYVEPDGTIGMIINYDFKAGVELCAGLWIEYGEDVRLALDQWATSTSLDAFRECDLAYNYSMNGNVLYSIVSLRNRVQLGVTDGRADYAAAWY